MLRGSVLISKSNVFLGFNTSFSGFKGVLGLENVVDLIMSVHLIDECCHLVSAIVLLSARSYKLSQSPDSLLSGQLETKPLDKL